MKGRPDHVRRYRAEWNTTVGRGDADDAGGRHRRVTRIVFLLFSSVNPGRPEWPR